jgi:Right handed beta helix region
MVSNLSLLDNRSYDNGGDGIFLENLPEGSPEGSPSANAVVTGNKSYGNLGSGIIFLNSLGGRIASNDLHGNCAGILVAAADTGFGTTTSGDVSVQRNQVTANNRLCPAVPFQMPAYGGIGIALIGAQNTTVELNVVRNNRSQAGSDIPGGGIVLLNGNIFGAAPPTGNSIRSNRLSGNTPYDIYCDGSGTLNSVSENSGSHSGC